MGEKGKCKEKRARPSSSTSDEHKEGGRHYEELLKLYKTLEQKDARKARRLQAYKPSSWQQKMK